MTRAAYLLVKFGDFSHINQNVQRHLAAQFPELQARVLDLGDLPITRPWRRAACRAAALLHYGPKALASRRGLYAMALRTPLWFGMARRLIGEALRDADLAFTVQTQSLFDAAQPGIPHFVYTDHTHLANLYYPAFDRGQLYAARWIRCERRIYDAAAINFTMSSHVSRSLVEHYGVDPARIECVRAGSNLGESAAADADPARYASRRILFVGVDWERKGGPLLARAFARLLQRMPDAHLTVVGCSPTIDLPNCEVVGRVPLAEVARYYARSAVFCLPTQIEPFGIVFLEAFANRLPIVATRVGALPDIVEEGVSGHLVAPDDAAGLADRLHRLLADPLLARACGEAGHRQVESRYTWQAATQAMARSIRRVAGLGTARATVATAMLPPLESPALTAGTTGPAGG